MGRGSLVSSQTILGLTICYASCLRICAKFASNDKSPRCKVVPNQTPRSASRYPRTISLLTIRGFPPHHQPSRSTCPQSSVATCIRCPPAHPSNVFRLFSRGWLESSFGHVGDIFTRICSFFSRRRTGVSLETLPSWGRTA